MIKNQNHLKICIVNIYISRVLLITNPSLLKKRITGWVQIINSNFIKYVLICVLFEAFELHIDLELLKQIYTDYFGGIFSIWIRIAGRASPSPTFFIINRLRRFFVSWWVCFSTIINRLRRFFIGWWVCFLYNN